MPLYFPDIYDFRLGTTGVTRIMLGDEQVWPIRRKIMEKIYSLDQIPDTGYIDCVIMNDDVHVRLMGNYGTTSCGDVYNFQYGPNTTLSNSGITDFSDWIIFRVSKPDYWPGTFVMQALDSNGNEIGTDQICQYLSYAGMGAWGFQNDTTGLIYASDEEGNLETGLGYVVQSSTHLNEQANMYAVRVGQLPTDPAMFLYKLSE